MPAHHERRIVPYTPAEMFALVADVERYPEFLPWCVSASVKDLPPVGACAQQEAELTVAFAHVREAYTSLVKLNQGEGHIHATHLKGPFSELDTQWTFVPKGATACQIDLRIQYGFRNRSLQVLMSMVFGAAVGRMAAAFEARARTLYGARR